MNTPSVKQENLKQRTQRSTKRLFVWTSSWLLSLATVALGPKFIWDFGITVTLITVFINLALGYKMIMANISHLNDMDEMQRKIQLEAMALSLGVSVVLGALYGLLEPIKIIAFEPNASGLLFIMSFSYMIGVAIFHRRHA